ncbi:hypothetical protein [Streptomyces iconiensis]|uniref:Uncharacterized protein n=1 Tax=Streptomyces iconiensis TaxID=1384038 RepID=A0ABT6ZXM0_9ACTN|nr:hypothetical protein [Streptomyces iconiensis]MDJ1133554.1 hypothetical protein [Streptomyces iconiensis]
MAERRRGTVWCGRVLLLATLLLGIVTMHTLGHPASEPAPSEPSPAAAQHVRAAPDTVAHMAAPLRAAPDAVAHVTVAHAMPAGDASSPHSGHGMDTDPMSVCLAVLGVWSAVALLGAAVVLVLRTRFRDLLAPRRTRTLRALRPLAPPSTSDRLARLSVLRI